MHKWVLVAFAAVTAFAETMQLVALMWTVLTVSGSPALVGVVNAFAFLPGVVVGIMLKRAFDKGSPMRSLARTNWVNVFCSIALTFAIMSELRADMLIVVFCASQAVMSVAKLANKSAVARALRLIVRRDELPAVQGRISSVTIIGGLVGSGLSGVILAFFGAMWCFAGASLLYALSVLLVRAARRYEPARATDATAAIASPIPPNPDNTATSAQRSNTPGPSVLTLVLVVSIPSSGALQFVSALLPSYADSLVPGSALFYSILDIATLIGGVLAGVVIGISTRMRTTVQRFALIISGVLCLLIFPISSPTVGAVLIAATSLTITVHVVGMQIATNLLAPEGKVGRFMAVRNAGVGLAKTVFSVSAGVLAQLGGVETAWMVLGLFLAGVAILLVCSPTWRRFASE